MRFKISAALIAAFLIPFLTADAKGEEKKKQTIVIWRLEAKTGVTDKDIDSISGFVTAEAEKTSGLKAVGEADIKAVLEGEQKKQQCGAEATSCMAEMGAALGAELAMSGDLGRMGDYWILNLRLINVKTVVVVKRVGKQIKGDINSLIENLSSAVKELFGIAVVHNGSLKVGGTPENATVFIDGREVGKTPLTKSLPAGKYKVEVKESSFLPQTKEVDVKSGEETFIAVTLEKKGMNRLIVWGHAAFWPGLALAGLGGAFTGLSINSTKDRDDNIKKGNTAAAKDSEDKAKAFGGAAVGGYVIGGLLMATGVVLWVVAPNDEKPGESDAKVGIIPVFDGNSTGLSVILTW